MSDLILNIGKTPNKVYFLVIFHDCMLFYRFHDFKPLLTLYLILRFVFLAYFLLLQKHVYLFNYRTFRLNYTFHWLNKIFCDLFLENHHNDIFSFQVCWLTTFQKYQIYCYICKANCIRHVMSDKTFMTQQSKEIIICSKKQLLLWKFCSPWNSILTFTSIKKIWVRNSFAENWQELFQAKLFIKHNCSHQIIKHNCSHQIKNMSYDKVLNIGKSNYPFPFCCL